MRPSRRPPPGARRGEAVAQQLEATAGSEKPGVQAPAVRLPGARRLGANRPAVRRPRARRSEMTRLATRLARHLRLRLRSRLHLLQSARGVPPGRPPRSGDRPREGADRRVRSSRRRFPPPRSARPPPRTGAVCAHARCPLPPPLAHTALSGAKLPPRAGRPSRRTDRCRRDTRPRCRRGRPRADAVAGASRDHRRAAGQTGGRKPRWGDTRLPAASGWASPSGRPSDRLPASQGTRL